MGWMQAGRAGAELSSACLAAWCPHAVCIFHVALVQRSINTCVANEIKHLTACCAGLGNKHGFYHSGSPSAELRGHLPWHTQPCGKVSPLLPIVLTCQYTEASGAFPLSDYYIPQPKLCRHRHTRETPQRKASRFLGMKVFMDTPA